MGFCLRKVWDANTLSPQELQQVVNYVVGNTGVLLFDHLMDSDYDGDRLDYVVRDASLTGVKYGLIDLDYLIENLAVGRWGTDRVLSVGRRKALHTLEHYLQGRYYMYSQVMYHKTVRAFETGGAPEAKARSG